MTIDKLFESIIEENPSWFFKGISRTDVKNIIKIGMATVNIPDPMQRFWYVWNSNKINIIQQSLDDLGAQSYTDIPNDHLRQEIEHAIRSRRHFKNPYKNN